jgi:hypothetical protein
MVNTPGITMDGTTEQNAIVTVNGIAVPNSNGAFAKSVALTEGINHINVVAIDVAGNNATASIRIILDTKVSLKVNGLSTGTVFETTNTTYEVTGTTDLDAFVYINDQRASMDNNGNFKVVVQLTLGMNNIVVKAQDQLGNKASYTYQVQRKEVPPPQKPPINSTTGNGPLGGMLVPILVVVALVAAGGVCAGLYMRKRGKAKEVQAQPVAQTIQTPPMAPRAPQTIHESQPPVPPKNPRT